MVKYLIDLIQYFYYVLLPFITLNIYSPIITSIQIHNTEFKLKHHVLIIHKLYN